jgi:hypothetical protein
MNPRIKIIKEEFYGKLLGGCNYAGFPIMIDYHITYNDTFFMILKSFMSIDESLEYKVSFDWGHNEWNSYKYNFSGKELKEYIEECDYSDDFLGVGFNEFFTIENVNIFVTEQNRESVNQFLDDFLKEIKSLYKEIDEYYKTHENIIKRT